MYLRDGAPSLNFIDDRYARISLILLANEASPLMRVSTVAWRDLITVDFDTMNATD